MRAKTIVVWAVPVILLALFSLLELTGATLRIEHAVYDTWLHIKPPVAERDDILFVDVDDLAINQVGVWPWSRDVMAHGLITMREFGGGPAVFDIEYTESSPLAVNSAFLRETLPSTFQREFDQFSNAMQSLLGAIQTGQIPADAALEYAADIRGMAGETRARLLEGVETVVRDNDQVMGAAARAHGRAYYTVNLTDDPEPDANDELIAFTEQNVALSDITVDPRVQVFQAGGIRPAILPILGQARGAGFPNVVIDEDGVRRRIELLREHEGRYYGQLVFRPLLDWLGNPRIEVRPRRVVLHNAVVPPQRAATSAADSTATGVAGATARTISIPIDADGRMLINWPPKQYIDSFRHISFFELVFYRRVLDDLAYNLTIMEESGYLNYHDGDRAPTRAYEFAEQLVRDAFDHGRELDFEQYRAAREHFLAEADAFLNGPAYTALLSDIDAALADQDLSADMRAYFADVRADVESVFANTRALYGAAAETRTVLEREIPGSFVIIGYTGTGTTDIGVNPFEKEYANTGTHGAVVNTILTGDFLDEIPLWISIAAAAALTLIMVLLTHKRDASVVLAVSFGMAALVVGASAGMLVFARLFFPVVTPVATLMVAGLAQAVYKYVEVAREKSFLRHAFSHYLSTDVINQILTDPKMLQLGGEKRELTAIFTDVKGFSTISEKLDPQDLVRLLNQYLTKMSDIVLDMRGTIDKFEGDAIIAFFGAPLTLEDHAKRACRAAIEMKKIEQEINREFLSSKLTPSPLQTRIGINTGEMVVGNMGTANRMDYTIMGHSVNLAARLEGVNKQYGTWILTSELTHAKTDAAFASRRLDRVRVVGVAEPVRLFELLDTRETLSETVRQLIEEFERGIDLFEGREFGEAAGIFGRLLVDFPEDGPSRTFNERCDKFIKSPPPPNWDGVFNLATK